MGPIHLVLRFFLEEMGRTVIPTEEERIKKKREEKGSYIKGKLRQGDKPGSVDNRVLKLGTDTT